jgi:hypothetical protein
MSEMENDKIENGEMKITCRKARRSFHLRERAADNAALASHLQSCARCERDYRVFTLTRATLDLAATPEPVTPDKDFFTALRARIARGPEGSAQVAPGVDESWTAVLMLTARQLIPAMAILLVIIIGLTLMFDTARTDGNMIARQPSERVLFNRMYDLPEPTTDDVLETLVNVEDQEDGK